MPLVMCPPFTSGEGDLAFGLIRFLRMLTRLPADHIPRGFRFTLPGWNVHPSFMIGSTGAGNNCSQPGREPWFSLSTSGRYQECLAC